MSGSQHRAAVPRNRQSPESDAQTPRFPRSVPDSETPAGFGVRWHTHIHPSPEAAPHFQRAAPGSLSRIGSRQMSLPESFRDAQRYAASSRFLWKRIPSQRILCLIILRRDSHNDRAVCYGFRGCCSSYRLPPAVPAQKSIDDVPSRTHTKEYTPRPSAHLCVTL